MFYLQLHSQYAPALKDPSEERVFKFKGRIKGKQMPQPASSEGEHWLRKLFPEGT